MSMPSVFGVIFGNEERVGRAVAGEDLVRDELLQRLARHAVLHQLRAHFLGRLALHQRLGLREEIREQDEVMLAERVLRLDRRDEVGRESIACPGG